jgi:hypothetical protein
MSALTKLARGMPCLVRLPGCNGNPETVVAAHYRSVSLGSGIAFKGQDWLSAYACSACHDLIDGRTQTEGYTKVKIRLAHLEGVIRTLLLLKAQGRVVKL